MKKIEISIIAGIGAYILIALWQCLQNPAVAVQAGVFAVILGILAALILAKHNETIKSAEMAAVWCCISLFAIYGVLAVTGVL